MCLIISSQTKLKIAAVFEFRLLDAADQKIEQRPFICIPRRKPGEVCERAASPLQYSCQAVNRSCGTAASC